MNAEEKQRILEKSKEFFKETIIPRHEKNTAKLKNLKEFKVNHFLVEYKANFLTGNSNPKSIAKALIYPRVLGSSLNTSFGSHMQKFCSSVLEGGFGSTTSGIDIEFEDNIDGRRKYCQVKAGPSTINKDDITTIINHFDDVRNLARTNNLNIGLHDLVVGVLYGEKSQLSANYKKINERYPVFVGKEFWHRLTGEEDFYYNLIDSFVEVASEINGVEMLNDTIDKLAIKIENSDLFS